MTYSMPACATCPDPANPCPPGHCAAPRVPEPVRLGTPPLGLPTSVDYHHLITLLTALLPGLNPNRVSLVRIDHRNVTVWYWDGIGEAAHVMPIEHVQGSATEGGHPTTPPTGLTDLDGSDAK